MNYYAQFEQDKILNDGFFKNKKNGIFVDIGAYDGICGSNTYFFEKYLNWTGMCIEPSPESFKKLEENRKCKCIHGCAWKKNEKKKFNNIKGFTDQLSGLIECYSTEHENRVVVESKENNSVCETIEVDCFDINELLETNGLFKIDLLSIDTEGSEFDILFHLDYKKFDINCIVCENNYNDDNIRKFLISHGFNFEYRGRIDDFFIKN